MIKSPYLLELNKIKNDRDSFILLPMKNIKSFNLKRIYFLINMALNEIRGNHAHKASDQFIFVLHGEVEINTISINLDKKQFKLKEHDQILFIPRMCWKSIKSLQDSSTIAVLTNKDFNEVDYIRDFEEFKRYTKD